MKCPNCEEARQQYKNGKTKAGSQRYRCHHCGCSYTPEKKVQGYEKAFRQKAIKMYIDGAGLRRTGRHLGIHHQTVANWTKEEAENYPTHRCLLKLEPQNLTRSSPILAIKKPHLSHYTC